ncbi:MAG: hypothetical protein V2A74_11725 [bacterium]
MASSANGETVYPQSNSLAGFSRRLRMIGDTIFALGVVVLGWFVLGLKTGWSLTAEKESLGEIGEPAMAKLRPTAP